MPLFRRYQIGMDCLFHCYHHHHHHRHHHQKRFTLSAAPDTLFNCFSKPTHNRRLQLARPIQEYALCARATRAFDAMLCCVCCNITSTTHLCYSAHPACFAFWLSNTLFSLLCTAKTLHFTVVFTGFRDFDLF